MADLWSDVELRNIYREFERLTSLCERTGAEVAAGMVSGVQLAAARGGSVDSGRPLLLHRRQPWSGGGAGPPARPPPPPDVSDAARSVWQTERPPAGPVPAGSINTAQPLGRPAPPDQHSGQQQKRLTEPPRTEPAAAESQQSQRSGRLAHLFFGRRPEPSETGNGVWRPEVAVQDDSVSAGRQSALPAAGGAPQRPERPARLGRLPDRPEVSAAHRSPVTANSGGGDTTDASGAPRQPPERGGRVQRTDRPDAHSWPRLGGQLSVSAAPPAGSQQRASGRPEQQGRGGPPPPPPPERPARREARQRGHPTASSEPWQPRPPPPPPLGPDARQQLEEERRQHGDTRRQLAAAQLLLRQEQQLHQQSRQQLTAAQQAAEEARQALRQAQQQLAATAVLRSEFVRASSAAASELDRLEERLREKEAQLNELRWQLHAVKALQLAEPPSRPPGGGGPGRPGPPPRQADTMLSARAPHGHADTLPFASAGLRCSENDAPTMSSSLSHFGSKSSLAQSLTGSSKSAGSHKAVDHYYEMASQDDKSSLDGSTVDKSSFGTHQHQGQRSYSEKSTTSKTNFIRMRGTGCKQKTSTMKQMITKVFRGTKHAKKATYNLGSSPMQKTRSEIGLFRDDGDQDRPRGCSTPILPSAATSVRSFSLQNIASCASAAQQRMDYLHSSQDREEVYEDVTDSEWDAGTEDEVDGSPFYINMEFNAGCLVPKGGH